MLDSIYHINCTKRIPTKLFEILTPPKNIIILCLDLKKRPLHSNGNYNYSPVL